MTDDVNMDFVIVMSEMSVMYYDHYCKMGVSYEGFCKKVENFFRTPSGEYVNKYYKTSFDRMVLFFQMELESQYGVVGDRATKIILDFFLNEFWLGIYNSQTLVNKRLFPNGYHQKLKRGI